MITILIGADALCVLFAVYFVSMICSLLLTVILRTELKIEVLDNICVWFVLILTPIINTLYLLSFLIIGIVGVIRDIWERRRKILPSVSEAFKIGTYVKLFKEIKEK